MTFLQSTMYRTTFLKNYDYCRATLSNIIMKRYAGHNKWSNIKHIKGANDQQKSLLFSKLSRQMKLAIRGRYTIVYKYDLCILMTHII